MLKNSREIKAAFDKACKYEQRATSCGQCTIAALQDVLEFVPKNDDVFRAASAFAGGLGFTGEGTCGALVGATMVIGLLWGRTRKEFDEDRKKEINEVDYVEAAKGWDLAYELYENFLVEYGSPICKNIQEKLFGKSDIPSCLQSIRPDSPVAKRLAERKGSHEPGGCCEVVGKAAKWAAEIILREKERGRL